VILLTNSKLYIVSKLIDHPVACLDIEQIFSAQFTKDEPETGEGFSGAVSDPDTSVLKIVYYDKSKFVREISNKKDPFDVASKFIKIKFKKVKPKVKAAFEARMIEEKQSNFATFF
jgi:hypothetical protein